MKLALIEQEMQKYHEAFTAFITAYKLPEHLFKTPDHFAIKCADELDYLDTCAALVNEVDDGIWEVSLDQRLLASAKLADVTSLGGFDFSWVEIMQPRPGKETEAGFVEHTEFYFPDFFVAEGILQQCGIEYTRQENPGHAWLNIVIDEAGREIKVNNKALADVMLWERAQGLLRQVEYEK